MHGETIDVWSTIMTAKETRQAYEKEFQAQVDEWRVEIDKLRAKTEQADANSRIKCQKQIEELRAMQDDAASKHEKLRHASGHAWLDIKKGAAGSPSNASQAGGRLRSRGVVKRPAPLPPDVTSTRHRWRGKGGSSVELRNLPGPIMSDTEQNSAPLMEKI